MPRLSPARMQERAFRTELRRYQGTPRLARILGQFDLYCEWYFGSQNENHPLWFPHLPQRGKEICSGPRRGKRSFLWQGACGQVTGGGGGGRAGPAPAALSFTGSDVGPDGKNRQAPKKGQSFGVPSFVWKGVPEGLNTTGTQYLEDSVLQGRNAAGTAPKPRAPNRVSALCPRRLRLWVIDLALGRLGDRGSSDGMLVPLKVPGIGVQGFPK